MWLLSVTPPQAASEMGIVRIISVTNMQSRKMRPERLAKRTCLWVLRAGGPGPYMPKSSCTRLAQKRLTGHQGHAMD